MHRQGCHSRKQSHQQSHARQHSLLACSCTLSGNGPSGSDQGSPFTSVMVQFHMAVVSLLACKLSPTYISARPLNRRAPWAKILQAMRGERTDARSVMAAEQHFCQSHSAGLSALILQYTHLFDFASANGKRVMDKHSWIHLQADGMSSLAHRLHQTFPFYPPKNQKKNGPTNTSAHVFHSALFVFCS